MSSTPPADPSAIPDRPSPPELPMTMASSMVLSNLPRDAAKALSQANTQDKVFAKVLFKPVGSAPPMPGRPLCKISSVQRFEAVVAYLRRQLKVGPADSVFLYVNSTFAPALDEVVGNLHRCFKDSKDQLIVTYSMTPAFG